MINVADGIWVGSSSDEENLHRYYKNYKSDMGKDLDISAVLNVAVDMPRKQYRLDIEYAQVGLVDGPGNLRSAYCASLLMLSTLLKRHKSVMVCCHDGKSRSIAVVVMYLTLKGGRVSSHPTFLNHWKSWDVIIKEIEIYCGNKIDDPHESHKEAWDNLPLGILEQLI